MSSARLLSIVWLACAALRAGVPQLDGSRKAVGPTQDWNARLPWTACDQALALARAKKRPVLVVAYAEWCGVCTTHSKLFHHPDVVRALWRFELDRLDVARHEGWRRA